MCLITFAYRAHADYNLILVANRDEGYARPTRVATPWAQDSDLIAGQDLKQGGTWLGIHRQGRLSAVTNYRDGRATAARPGLRSRGHLTRDFLLSDRTAAECSQHCVREGAAYGGFNLLLGDSEGLYYLSNQGRGPERLGPGIYGLSNALLDTPWPKVRQARDGLSAALCSRQLTAANPAQLARRLIEVLAPRDQAPDAALPQTGISPELERRLSPCFIQLEHYGTRATTVILQDNRGNTLFHEQSFDALGPTDVREYSLQLPLIGARTATV